MHRGKTKVDVKSLGYPKRLTNEVARLKSLGHDQDKIGDILADREMNFWITCVKEGTWADTQGELKTAKDALRTAVKEILKRSK